jgi:hypothetical protein
LLTCPLLEKNELSTINYHRTIVAAQLFHINSH